MLYVLIVAAQQGRFLKRSSESIKSHDKLQYALNFYILLAFIHLLFVQATACNLDDDDDFDLADIPMVVLRKWTSFPST